jgi:5,5'-dehydrodivanillate O-demethylase
MGNLLRRYWHPVAASAELVSFPTKAVRLLGEDLVLYKDKSGTLGLIEERCAHRRVNMVWGIPEQVGLRCPYHGWLYDETGQCLEQPGEPTGSTFKDRIHMTSYPVQELGGLIFAYLGPEPVPLLPRYDVFAMDNAVRQIGGTMLPCNFVQAMENSLDPVHLEWLHGYFTNYVHQQKYGVEPLPQGRRHAKIGFDRFEHGIYKRRIYEGGSEADATWSKGHPIVFPTILRIGSTVQIRVPVDDTHTWHLLYEAVRPGVPVEEQNPVPYYDLPRLDDRGQPLVEMNALGQDFWAWYSQGEIAQREKEKLGVSDIGIILYRDMCFEQMEKVERGEDPIEVYRDPEQNQLVAFDIEGGGGFAQPTPGVAAQGSGEDGPPVRPNIDAVKYVQSRFYPAAAQIRAARQAAAARAAAGQPLLPKIVPPDPQVDPEGYREGVINPAGIKTG